MNICITYGKVQRGQCVSTPGGYFKTLTLDQAQENLERLEKKFQEIKKKKKKKGNDLRRKNRKDIHS